MNGDRWDRIESLFHAAVESEAERQRVLAETADIDPALARELEALLAADSRADRFLEDPPGELITLFGAPPAELAAGTRIGAYAVVREIGRGGMGTVYLADRADGQFEQRVAIKLLRHGMDTADILRRFWAERQILANLQHPNIARLLDGGMSEDGRPYLVMEHIEGIPIDEYCDRHRLSVDRRIELFRAVCSAVQHAHRNLVVHRDLKPGNILVTADGVPKLLDFGIAKLLDPDRLGRAAAATRTGLHLMSPEYASPEQVTGDPITTATDVYALGIVLYLLLTGRHPHHPDDAPPAGEPSLHELQRRIREVEPARPSAVVGPPDRLRRRLAGDLDNIVLMALRKEPERRYSSVEQLSLDLGRHLAGQPVSARKDTLRYRAAKFARRNRAAVTAAVLVGVSVVGGAAATGWQARRAAEERDRARIEADKARQVAAFLVDVFEVSDPEEARNDSVTARELLERGAARVTQELSDQPEVQAEMLHAIGRVYRNLGLYTESKPLLERSVEILRRSPDVPATGVAAGLNSLGLTLHEAGEMERAERTYEQALALAGSGAGSDGDSDPGSRALRAEILNNLGSMLYERGEHDRAEGPLREALTIRLNLYGPEHADVATSKNSLARLLDARGEGEAAEPLYREALETRRRILGPEHPRVATSLNNLALLLRRRGDLAGAEPLYEEALEIRRRSLGPDHPRLAAPLNNLAMLARARGRYDRADSLFREALAIYRKEVGDGHPRVATLIYNLAGNTLMKDDYPEAEAQYRRAVELMRETLPPDHPRLGYALVGHGRSLFELGRFREAEGPLRAGLAIALKDARPGTVRWIAGTQRTLGECLQELGRYTEAEALLLESYEALHAEAGPEDEHTLRSVRSLARLYQEWDRPRRAAEFNALLDAR